MKKIFGKFMLLILAIVLQCGLINQLEVKAAPVDSEPPIIHTETFNIEKEVVVRGESISFSVKITDNVGISEAYIYLVNQNTNKAVGCDLKYNSQTQMYEYTLLIDDQIPAGHWTVSYASAKDEMGNSTLKPGNSYNGFGSSFLGDTFIVTEDRHQYPFECEIEELTLEVGKEHSFLYFYKNMFFIHSFNRGVINFETQLVKPEEANGNSGFGRRVVFFPRQTGDTIVEIIDDKTKQVCKLFKVKVEKHAWSDWKTNEDGHWKECADCGKKTDVQAHTMSDWKTDENGHWKECTVCGKKIDVQAHTMSDWRTDENGHWKECTVCGEKTDVQAHTMSDWRADENGHWKECTVCGKKKELVAHTMSDWRTDENGHWKECTVCGKKTELQAHTMSDWRADENRHWKECTVCGMQKESLSHTMSDWKTDENGHWRECTVCGKSRNVESHIMSGWIIVKPSTEMEEGLEERQCITCGYKETKTIPILQNTVIPGWKKDDQGWKYQNPDGSYPKSQWKLIEGEYYYFGDDGYRYEQGWHWINGKCYYMYSNGTMASNTWIDGSYVDASGAWVEKPIKTGWQSDSVGWWYNDASGNYVTGWRYINNYWYYFASSGYMEIGWEWIGEKCYYFYADGHMASNEWIDGSYVDASGAWVEKPIKTGWQSDSVGWWYNDVNGNYVTGWKYINNYWYFFSSNGYMQTGWKWIDGKCYYFYTDGHMASNEWIDGSYVNNSGAWVQ